MADKIYLVVGEMTEKVGNINKTSFCVFGRAQRDSDKAIKILHQIQTTRFDVNRANIVSVMIEDEHEHEDAHEDDESEGDE